MWEWFAKRSDRIKQQETVMRKALFFVATLGLSLATTPALAQTASSSGYALSANETVRVGDVVTATVNIAPVAASSGTAPPSYNTSNSVASVNQSTTLTSGILG